MLRESRKEGKKNRRAKCVGVIRLLAIVSFAASVTHETFRSKIYIKEGNPFEFM